MKNLGIGKFIDLGFQMAISDEVLRPGKIHSMQVRSEEDSLGFGV